jgi:hypothetical protein
MRTRPNTELLVLTRNFIVPDCQSGLLLRISVKFFRCHSWVMVISEVVERLMMDIRAGRLIVSVRARINRRHPIHRCRRNHRPSGTSTARRTEQALTMPRGSTTERS